MEMDKYQELAMRTAGDCRPEILAMGLAGEVGEVVDYLKKVIGHGHPLDKERLCKEIGDAQWYLAVLAWAYGLELGHVAKENIAKLEARYPNGFSTLASLNRVDK